MKRLFNLFCCISAAIFSLSGCFKPDAPKVKDADLLYGYWEVVHTHEEGHSQSIMDDGSIDHYVFDDSYPIAAGDGRCEYAVLYFDGMFVSFVATDDPEIVDVLNVPSPYRRSGDKLYGYLFEGDFCKYVTIKTLNEEELVLYMDDSGVEEDGLYDIFHQTLTFRRIK